MMSEKTERPEAVEAGTVKLVGTDEERIVAEATCLLEDHAEYARMTRVHNPYGDGQASKRIAEILSVRAPSFVQNKADNWVRIVSNDRHRLTACPTKKLSQGAKLSSSCRTRNGFV
jgi:UDP-N-acetylglucosamine 2-epimerase